MNQILNLSIILAISIIFVSGQKPGSCPPSPDFGICVEACSHDFSCPENLKCCSNGCGHVCQAPVSDEIVKPIEEIKSCPEYEPNLVGLCVITEKSCWDDSMCQPNQKCCRKGCGRECMSKKYDYELNQIF
ncbi:WAP four-disulfide core domain 18-like [Brachionus plicatilis]|uniref:WAP four-disulfide core domain 18-like n=1 Tax=Brachionus plicatilis TaxID=10195 RepID=A0A3M7SCF9_BRAPC|nr:WAP four-disulfide core domain 18-like [Brachionus plicatilis]